MKAFGLVDGGNQAGTNLGKVRGDILLFEGSLDLTKAGVGERITHIETLSMVGSGSDRLTLSAQDVLDLGEGGSIRPSAAGTNGAAGMPCASKAATATM